MNYLNRQNSLSSGNLHKRSKNLDIVPKLELKHTDPVKEEEEQKINYFGFHQWCNFGKHKGKTFYDIANESDFKYLKWLRNGPHKEGFAMNPSCIPHIECALDLENHRGHAFRLAQTPADEKGRCQQFYTYEDNGQTVKSPVIEMMQCKMCMKSKNKECFPKDKEVCQRCLTIALS